MSKSFDQIMAEIDQASAGYGQGDSTEREVGRQVQNLTEQKPFDTDPEPMGVMGRVVDLLSRGQYASAGFAEEVVSNRLFTQPAATLGDALTTSVREFFNPQSKLSFSDVIKNKAPKFAQEHPIGHRILGFMGDVALDPLTYVTLGTGVGAKVGIKGGQVALSKTGRKALAGLTEIERKATMAASKRVQEAHTKIVRTLVNNKGWDVEDAFAIANKQLDAVAKNPERALARFNSKYAIDIDVTDITSWGRGSSLKGANERGLAKLSGIMTDEMLDKGGVKFMGKTLIEGEKFAPISKAIGIPEFKTWVGGTKVGTAVRHAFQRAPKEIPSEVITMEREFYKNMSEGERRMLQGFDTLFHGTKKDSRYAVGVAMGHIDDMGQKIGEALSVGTTIAGDPKNVAKYLNAKEAEEFFELAKVGPLPDSFVERVVGRNVEEFLDSPALQTGLWDDTIRAAEARVGKPSRTLVKQLKDRRAKGLDDAEKSLLAAFTDDMKRFGKIEMEGRLLKGMKQNYFPRYYEMIKDPKQFTSMFGRLRGGLASTFTPDETRKFKTLIEAQEAGFDPIYDAATVYAMRVSQHYERKAKGEFYDDLVRLIPDLEGKLGSFGSKATLKSYDELFDLANPEIIKVAKAAKKSGKEADRQLGHILERVRFISRPMYDPLDTPMKNDMLKIYDRALGLFRSSATVLRPAFGARNVVSNQFQMFLGGGMQAVRHLNVFVDPRCTTDALALLRAHGKPEMLKKMRNLKTVHGNVYSPYQVIEAARDYNIVRNVAIEGIGAGPVNNLKGARRITRELDRKIAVKSHLFKNTDNVVTDGMTAMFSGSKNYWDVPAMLEDHSRLTLFTNMLKQGYTPKGAAEAVERALFDYTHGLTQFETRVMRRLIPFYSFQRYAIPLVTRMTGRSLGTQANAMKTGKALMEVWGKINRGDAELTNAERHAVPGYLIEQPHTFAGFQKDMLSKFHVFNNFTPLDVLAFVESDETTGEMDFGKSLLNGSLAQMTPFLKVPMELALNKNLFTGRTFDSSINQGELDVDRLFGNLVAAATANVTQFAGGPGSTPAIIAGRALAVELAQAQPDIAVGIMKHFLGYEEGVDPRTGKDTVYFNPYKLHLLTSVLPGMNEAIRHARADKTPVERTMRLVFGVGVQKRDLQRDAGVKQYLNKRRATDLRSETRNAMRNNQDRTSKRKLGEYQNFLRNWAGETEILQSGPIRGPLAADIDTAGPHTLESIFPGIQQ